MLQCLSIFAILEILSACQVLLLVFFNLPGLASVKTRVQRLAAFSNGEVKVVREVLEHAQLLELFDDVISADEVTTFKPDPAIYGCPATRSDCQCDLAGFEQSFPYHRGKDRRTAHCLGQA
jgi:HAD superfamily hydrolase (TIGR01493 family)